MSRALAATLCAILLAVTAAAALSREQHLAVLDEAQQAAERGAALRRTNPRQAQEAFHEAAEKFQLLVDDGVRNGRLYYNLGNARLESGRLGRAIASYRRAERLIPGDARLAHNLAHARSLRRTEIGESAETSALRTLFFWHYRTSPRTRATVALATYLSTWIVLGVHLLRPAAVWRWVVLPLGGICLVLAASLAVDLYLPPAPAGVLVTDGVVVRKGNGEGFEPLFKQTLNEGVEFVVREQRRSWLEIELPDGRVGWIRADQAELI